MAENGDAEKHADSDQGAGAQMQGATTPPRAKPLIEGEAISPVEPQKAAAATPQPENSQNVAAMSAIAAALAAADAQASDTQAEVPPEDHPIPLAAARPRRGMFWPLAAALVIGAIIAFGGALALREFEKTPQTLASLDARLRGLEQTMQNAQAQQEAAAGLDKRLGALENGAQAMNAALVQLRGQLRDLQSAAPQDAQTAGGAAGAPAAAAPNQPPLSERLDRLEQTVAALDQRLTALTTQMHSAQSEKNAAALAAVARAEADSNALLAADLRRKVEAGEPFSADLTALANHGLAKERLAKLEPFAASGIKTQAALARDFAALAPAIEALEPEPKPQGFLGRLAQDAARLVRIRKIGDMKGDDVSAHLARIAAALETGRLDDALRSWDDLPAAAKAKSQAFGESLLQRVAALEAAKAIETDALAALAKVKS
jgi:hypothetical protein